MIYALLIYDNRDPARPWADVPMDAASILARHRAMQDEAMLRQQLLATARLALPDAAHTVRSRGEAFEVSDGPFMEAKEWLVGFYLVECDDEAAAFERARQIATPGLSIEVRPVTWQRIGAAPPPGG